MIRDYWLAETLAENIHRAEAERDYAVAVATADWTFRLTADFADSNCEDACLPGSRQSSGTAAK